MRDMQKNAFLNRVCAKLREQRPLIPDNCNFLTRVERVHGAPFVSIWFRTRGCGHDHQGGCTMCNYGASSLVSAEEMIGYVREGLDSLHCNGRMMLLVSPSGSMFDDWEVPAEAREAIFRLVSETKCKTYICETRVDTLTEDRVRHYAGLLDNKGACISVGLECANPRILKYCINKSLSLEKYKQVIQWLRKYQVSSSANVLLGTPFLSTREAIEDTVQTIRWAFSHETDMCVIFPVHVKSWTLAEWLWENGLYAPPSLWSLVEVLARLGPQLTPRIAISWYKAYHEVSAVVDSTEDIVCSPSTCAACQPTVMELLDTYRDTQDYGIVEELARIECDCKRAWRLLLEAKESLPLKERVAQSYEAIGQEVLGVEWWTEHGEGILKDVLDSKMSGGNQIL